MPPEDPPNAPNTPADPTQADALKKIIEYVDHKIAAGEPKDTVIQDTAREIGWTPDQLMEQMNTAVKEGDTGRGVMTAMTTILGTVTQQNNDREGKREVNALSNDKKLGEAFEEHEAGFRAWLRNQKVTYDRMAEPGTARKFFDYYLKSETNYEDKLREKERDRIREEERDKIQKELGVRTRVAPAPGLPTSGKPEGGALRNLVTAAGGASVEPTENQTEIMANLGLSPERQKKAMETQAQKTVFGTPLPFIITKNKGAVS